MGVGDSKLESIFRSLDVDRDGYLSRQEFESWILDEHFLGNPLFDPHVNGLRNTTELTNAFFKFVDANQDGKISKSDLSAYCRDMTTEEMIEITSSLGELFSPSPPPSGSASTAANSSGRSSRAPSVTAAEAASAASASIAAMMGTPSASALASARREKLLRRIFDVLDTNGSSVLEEEEVTAWMENEAQRVLNCKSESPNGTLLPIHGNLLGTEAIRAEVWKQLHIRPPPPTASPPLKPVAPPATAPSQPTTHFFAPQPQPQKKSISSMLNPWKSTTAVTTPAAVAHAAATPSASAVAAAAAKELVPNFNLPVRFDDFKRFVSKWSIRELRLHFEDMIAESDERKCRLARRRAAELLANPPAVPEEDEDADDESARPRGRPSVLPELDVEDDDEKTDADGLPFEPMSPSLSNTRLMRASSFQSPLSSTTSNASNPPATKDAPLTPIALSRSSFSFNRDGASDLPPNIFVLNLLRPYLPTPITPEIQSSLDAIMEITSQLEVLSQESIDKARENLEVNAIKRQLNEEIAQIEVDLLSLDQTRLILCDSVNDAQNDYNLLANKNKETEKKLEAAHKRMLAISQKHEETIGTLSTLQNNTEKEKEKLRILSEELSYISNLDKNFPAQQKLLLNQINKYEQMKKSQENSISEIQKLKETYEKEIAAIESAQEAQRKKAAAEGLLAPPSTTEAPSTSSAAAGSGTNSRRGSTSSVASDASSVAGAGASLDSLTPPRSRSGSMSGADATGDSAEAAKNVSSVGSLLGSAVHNIQAMLPNALAHPIDALTGAPTGDGSASSSSHPPHVHHHHQHHHHHHHTHTSAPPAANDAYSNMKARIQGKLKDLSKQEKEAQEQLNTVNEVLAQFRAKQEQEAEKMKNPKAVNERISVLRVEVEAKKTLVASLNAQQIALQKQLNNVDMDRKSNQSEYKSHDAGIQAFQVRLGQLESMIEKGEEKLKALGMDKENLTDQMRLKISTQSILSSQQSESVIKELDEINHDMSHLLHLHRSKQAGLVKQLQQVVRAVEWNIRRERMRELGIEISEKEGEGPKIQSPEIMDEQLGMMRSVSMGVENATTPDGSSSSSSAPGMTVNTQTADSAATVASLQQLFAPCQQNHLLSPLLGYRSNPFPCVAYVTIEAQVPGGATTGSGGSGNVTARRGSVDSSSSSTPSSSFVGVGSTPFGIATAEMPPLPELPVELSSQGLLNISGNIMLYDSDVSVAGSRSEPQPSITGGSNAPLALASLSRFCIDITRDVLDAYFLDRFGHANEQDFSIEEATPTSPLHHTHAPETAATTKPASSAAQPIAVDTTTPSTGSDVSSSPQPSTSSLLLSFRPGYRNRFLFNIDRNESALTSASTGNGSLLGSNSIGLSNPAASSPGSALMALTSPGGNQPRPSEHNVKLTAETKTLRRIYHTLSIYIEKRKQAESAALMKASAAIAAKNREAAAAAKPGATNTSTGKPLPQLSAAVQAQVQAKRLSLMQPSLYEVDNSVFIEGSSELVNMDQLRVLVKACPSRYTLNVWGLVYSMSKHGVSRTAFFETLQAYPCAIVILRDMRRTVFGGFASVPFNSNSNQGYYGSGECYVFKVGPPAASSSASSSSSAGSVQVFRWRGADDYFMITGDSYIAMGGGSAYAWQIDSVFRYGTSGPCSTFESPMLTQTKEFETNDMEVWCPIHDQLDFEIGVPMASFAPSYGATKR